MGTHAGQIVLVTGASRGIGRAVAEHFGGAGATIIAVARNRSQLEDLARTITERGGVCRPYAVDLADLEAVQELAAAVESEFGRLDVLIGNAAVFPGHLLVHEVTPAQMSETIQINFLSNWCLLRSCHAMLRRSKAGRVVFISSSNAYGGYPQWSAYAASKAALDRVMAAYAAENEDTPIRCNSLSPGPVRTDMGLFANKGDGNGMVAPEAILPMFDMLADPGLRHTGQMFEFRHFQGSKPLEVWTVRRY